MCQQGSFCSRTARLATWSFFLSGLRRRMRGPSARAGLWPVCLDGLEQHLRPRRIQGAKRPLWRDALDLPCEASAQHRAVLGLGPEAGPVEAGRAGRKARNPFSLKGELTVGPLRLVEPIASSPGITILIRRCNALQLCPESASCHGGRVPNTDLDISGWRCRSFPTTSRSLQGTGAALFARSYRAGSHRDMGMISLWTSRIEQIIYRFF